MIDGTCVANGENSPFDVCLYCSPSSSTTSWTTRVPCGSPPVDMGVPGEDMGVPGEDMGVPGEDMGTTAGDGGMTSGDAGGFVTSPGGRRRGGCDVGTVGASEGGGMLAIAMLLVVAFVRRGRRSAFAD
jgi:MYXO-CTERM domain-containing protein